MPAAAEPAWQFFPLPLVQNEANIGLLQLFALEPLARHTPWLLETIEHAAAGLVDA